MLPEKLKSKIAKRKTNNLLRVLGKENALVDFSSNDYLGFSKSREIFEASHQLLKKHQIYQNGSTGSRLLTGNHMLYAQAETFLAQFHQCEDALIFNSGYDANVGLFSSVPQQGDVVFYDEYIHASIRDGITICKADAFKFKHNDLGDLRIQLEKTTSESTIYVVSESIFSMDGDSPELTALIALCNQYSAHLIIDEAHALGVTGNNGKGMLQDFNNNNAIFARIVTFGKALGCHGAAILGSKDLKQYLINYARSMVYTTGLPPHSISTILCAYTELERTDEIDSLHRNIDFFKNQILKNRLHSRFIESNSAIQSCVIRGNEEVKQVAEHLILNGFNVKPILYPSVAKGQERLRFCIHSFNKQEDMTKVLTLLSNFVGQKMTTINEREL